MRLANLALWSLTCGSGSGVCISTNEDKKPSGGINVEGGGY
jgi:hypothetical protein